MKNLLLFCSIVVTLLSICSAETCAESVQKAALKAIESILEDKEDGIIGTEAATKQMNIILEMAREEISKCKDSNEGFEPAVFDDDQPTSLIFDEWFNNFETPDSMYSKCSLQVHQEYQDKCQEIGAKMKGRLARLDYLSEMADAKANYELKLLGCLQFRSVLPPFASA
mmetsp:Transcript_13472/g.15435  ORF Transcript_13472/g.15435 Transcript_13472/m.15435 type:complete len:169 (-) Transcript_13472:167-673(-)|eukprot:CAMPEP_0176415876 /NCGR_PEP_ID=MMETSP0127-20121128/6041_1 /TAXON_ID=938130 /ORGANISM="Platyophrya macrostoma, Strain WH" /LENGTH=168 /DNA_ID=CAMNT_0017795903 /DNA_START=44 /DNA_END=550 /DNA_ORIENTATION=-